MIVKVVSRQFESVRVEQNHCQGLQMVRTSYGASHRKHQSLYEGKRFRDCIQLVTRVSTYGCPCFFTFVPICLRCQLPRIIIAQCRKYSLRYFGGSDQEVGVPVSREL